MRSNIKVQHQLDAGLHQDLALSPFLFPVIMDKLTEDIRKDAPWDILFGDDIVLSRQNHRELENDLRCGEMHWKEEA